jgi:hypothetical protein
MNVAAATEITGTGATAIVCPATAAATGPHGATAATSTAATHATAPSAATGPHGATAATSTAATHATAPSAATTGTVLDQGEELAIVIGVAVIAISACCECWLEARHLGGSWECAGNDECRPQRGGNQAAGNDITHDFQSSIEKWESPCRET